MKRVELPDGTIGEFPADMPDSEIEAVLRRQFSPPQKMSMLDLLKQDLINIGTGAVRGAGSIGATLMSPVDAAARAIGVQNDLIGRTDRREAMDQWARDRGADTDSIMFGGGKLGTEIAGTMGVGGALGKAVGMVPRAAPMAEALTTAGFKAGGLAGVPALLTRAGGGAVTGAASAGLVNPEDAGTGAMIGGALPLLTKASGVAGHALGGVFKPNTPKTPLAQTAVNKYGIPLSVSDVSDSAIVKGARSWLDDMPVIGGIGQRQNEAKQAAFNKAVGKTFDAPAPSLTPAVMDDAKKRLGAEFDRIWNNNDLLYDAPLFQKVQQLRAEVNKLPQGDAQRLASWLDDLESKMVPDANGNLRLPGDVANKFQSKLRETVSGASGFIKDDLAELRKAILAAFNRNVSPEDAAALSDNMRKYKAFKTVEPLLQKAEAGVAGRDIGDVPAALLPQQVYQQYGASISNSPFADLSQIGSQFVADRVARTGGSGRAAVQNMATGAALFAGGPATWLLGPPLLAGAEGLLSSPAVTRAMLNAQPLTYPGLLGPSLFRAAPVLAADQ